MKVLHVIPAVATCYGGPSQAIFEMCRALGEQGTDVLIATTDADGPGRLAVETRRAIEYQGVPTIFFARRWSERFGYSPTLGRWLDDQAAGFDTVHIHAVFSHPCIAAAHACRNARVPYVVRPLGSLDPWSMRQKPLRKRVLWYLAVDRMLKGAAAIHYTTDEERRLAESSLGLEKGVVIPLGITLNEREQGSDGRTHFRHERLGQRPYVLTLSRLHPKKNIEVLIEAFLSLAEQRGYGDWRLVIAGDGEPRYVESLERLVKERGGEERVLLVGWLGGEEKRAALEGAALLALPSHQENFGIAAAEALAAGVPVLVSAQVNLAPEIAARGAGWVTSLDKSEIARTLAEALGDAIERRRRGQAGRRFVAQRLSWERLAADLVRLYATLCGGEARPKAQYSIC